jgi:hypothetical protein
MPLEAKRKYLAKQTLTNKYSEFKSAYHLVMAFCCLIRANFLISKDGFAIFVGDWMPELELCKVGSNLLHKRGPRIFQLFQLCQFSTSPKHFIWREQNWGSLALI